MYEFSVVVCRHLAQKRGEGLHAQVNYLAHTPRGSRFEIKDVQIDPPVEVDFHWFYRATITYTTVDGYSTVDGRNGAGLDRDRLRIVSSVRKAAGHAKWGRSTWQVEGPQFPEETDAPLGSIVADEALPDELDMHHSVPTIEHVAEPSRPQAASAPHDAPPMIDPLEDPSGNVVSPRPTQEPEDSPVVVDVFHDDTPIRRAAKLFDMARDPNRLKVLLILRRGPRNVTEICEDLGSQSQPAVSHHLALLRSSSLIAPRRQGKNNYYWLTPQGREFVNQIAPIVGDW